MLPNSKDNRQMIGLIHLPPQTISHKHQGYINYNQLREFTNEIRIFVIGIVGVW